MPLENDIDKVLIIGSGPTLVGSVAEMDLLANDAIDALVEEGIHVVLVNPNPATVSTDKREGVTVYLEPMTLDFFKRILRMEEPDAIITAFGSTTSLKVAKKLLQDGILQQMHIRLLTLNHLALAMDDQKQRNKFLSEIGVNVNLSWQLNDRLLVNQIANLAKQVKDSVVFPVQVTKYHKYVHNEHLRFDTASKLLDYFKNEHQNDDFSWKNYHLVEDLSSWEEITVNVIRDQLGNLVFINFIDSLESVGINSGDSIAIMPALTLNNDQVQELRSISSKIVNKLEIVGIASIHFAIKHHGTQIQTKVLSIKSRLTRSAAWIQRSGIYSVGYVVAKIAIGYQLSEITDPASGLCAAIEPTLDTISIRAPYWSLTETGTNHYHLGNLMQASGEALGIGRNFESAFLKALDSTMNTNVAWNVLRTSLFKDKAQLIDELKSPDELHLIKTLAAIAKGAGYAELQNSIHLHPIYYQKLKHIVDHARKIKSATELDANLLSHAKRYGFTNEIIANLRNETVQKIDQLIEKYNIRPSYIQLDGSAGFHRPNVNAYYSAYDVENELEPLQADKKILIIGMLPLQVSVTNEFDYMLSHVIKTLHNNNYATILLSNNSESVSSRYIDLDRVYFDPITVENILAITKKEHINQVLIQFSGKKVNSLSQKLRDHGIDIIGKDFDPFVGISSLINEELDDNGFIKKVPSLVTTNIDDIIEFTDRFGFPILIGGFDHNIKQKSAVVYDLPAVKKYLHENNPEKITISRFIEGQKYEVTAISDGTNVTIPGIIEHLEQTGSHASDSIAVFRPQNLSITGQNRLANSAITFIKKLHTRGIFNLHFLKVENEIFLLQIKPYAGHNVAFLSKALKHDLTAYTIEVLIGKSLTELNCKEELWPTNDYIHVKMPVFSFINYHSENTFDSKMKSSGSVMGRDTQLAKALYKGYEASDLHIPSYGTIFISVRDEDKNKIISLARRFDRLGFKLIATEGTANVLAEAGITTGVVEKIHQNSYKILNRIRRHKINMVINITNLSDTASDDAIRIRDQALFTHIPVFSSIETTELILNVLEALALTTQPI